VSGLTVLAIVIACSGLFALSLYSVSQRSKEISIRKILGASVSGMVVLLSKNTLTPVISGGVLTAPIMYYSVSLWLTGYAYKMQLEGWMFIVPVITVLLLVFATISFQTIKVAKRNPVENIREL
jgi:putative ABC transport system permease protein